jgi:hypothetical protein
MARTAEDLLQELLALDESQRIEAKRCTQIDRSVMETVCAFVAGPALASNQTAMRGATVTSLGPDRHQPGADSHQWLATIPASIGERLPAALNRTEHKPLVRDCLSPMGKQGVLDYTVPEMENHPDQRYTLPAESPMP